MKRGPKPAPASVKAQKGAVRSKRETSKTAAADAPAVAVVSVAPTPDLDGDALDRWHRIAPDLIENKLLVRGSAEAFARYCKMLSTWWKMMRQVETEGHTYTVKSAHGTYIRPHPLLGRLESLEVRLIAFEDRHGMNAAERQRIMAARAAAGMLGAGQGDLPLDQPGADAGAREPGSPAPSASPIGLLN